MFFLYQQRVKGRTLQTAAYLSGRYISRSSGHRMRAGRLFLTGAVLWAMTSVAMPQDRLAESLGLTRSSGSLPIWEKPSAQAMEDLSEQIHGVNPGVMIIGNPGGGYGTGFVISKEHRLLATNAHVADIRHPSGELFAIANGSSKAHEIDAIWYHPGVVRQKTGGLKFRSMDPAMGDVFPLSPDVAVLHVAGDTDLPEPIALADMNEIRSVFAKPVGMIGFPGHDTVSWPGIGEKAQSTYRQGVIARATDFYNDANADPRDLQFLQHTMANWFGFSGSPIFLPNGHVVALNNSARSVKQGEMTTTLAFGVRTDCLWELLAFHHLESKVPIPVSVDGLRLSRFAGDDPRIKEYQQAKDLLDRGTVLLLENKFSEAGDLFNEAIRKMPNLPRSHGLKAENHSGYAFALGDAKVVQKNGRLADYVKHSEIALKEAETALQLDPTDVGNLLAVVLMKSNLAKTAPKNSDRPEDRAIVEKVLGLESLSPYDRAHAYQVYGVSFPYAEQAIPWLTKAIEVFPFSPDFYSTRSRHYEAMGNQLLASADRRRAEQLFSAAAAGTKAWRLATTRDDTVRDGTQAVHLAEEACRITGYKYWLDLDTLAAAHAEQGNFDEAVRWAAEAMKLAPDKEKSRVAPELRSYRNHKPWRQ